MKLSVVTATYNRGPIVRQMIESTLAQSRPPDEIIVSDDCSSDTTQEVLSEIAREWGLVKVIHQPKNTGGVMNWNHALNAASGDIIAWCSDDDRLAPGHLEYSLDYLTQNPGVDMVHSGFINVWQDEHGTTTESHSPLYSAKPFVIHGAQVVSHIINHYCWPFHPSTLVFRRSLWESVGQFDRQYDLADTDWFIRAVIKHKVAYLPRYGALNRRHMGNWSQRTGSVKMHVEVDQAIRAGLRSLDVPFPQRAALASWWVTFHLYRLARLFLARSRAGQIAVARNIMREILRALGRPGTGAFDEFIIRLSGTIAVWIRRIQERFPDGVRRYEAMGKWEPL